MPLTPVRVMRIVPKALSFDGIDDYVEVPDFLPQLSEITVETLFYVLSEARYGLVTQADYTGWRLYTVETELDFGILATNDKYYYVHYTPPESYASVWHHLVGIYRKPNLELWHDKQRVAAWTVGDYDIKDSTAPILIGATWTGSNPTLRWFVKGYIALVRIYDRALTEDEIRHNYYFPNDPVKDGLVLWLHWDSIDVGAGKWYDKSGYGNDGTIYGATEVEIIKSPVRTLTPTRLLSPVR